LVIAVVPVLLIALATELPRLQAALLTTSLTGAQWLASIGLALVLPLVIEVSKWERRRRLPQEAMTDVQQAVTPIRARTDQSEST
jgi:Ca2+-transporting ATPase